MRLLWVVKREMPEAFLVVLVGFFSIARRHGKGSTLLAVQLRRMWGHSVLWAGEGLDVRTSTAC